LVRTLPDVRAAGSNLRRALRQPARAAVWISGTVQTIFYCDFFYYYLKSWKNNERLSLPA
jgi:hypothetical protein